MTIAVRNDRRAGARGECERHAASDENCERDCFLELNAQPDRLDLNDTHCRMAKELGLKIAISTDANLDLMRFGIDKARRGWLEPNDVLNTRSWPRPKQLLRRA